MPRIRERRDLIELGGALVVRLGDHNLLRFRWRTKRIEILPIEGAQRVRDGRTEAGDPALDTVAD